MDVEKTFKKLKLLATTNDPKEFYRTVFNPTFAPHLALNNLIESVCPKEASILTEKLIHYYLTDEEADQDTINAIQALLKPLAHYFELADPELGKQIEKIADEFKESKNVKVLEGLKNLIGEQGTVIRRIPDLMAQYFSMLHGVKAFYRLYEATKDYIHSEKLDSLIEQINQAMKERQKELLELCPALKDAQKPEDLCVCKNNNILKSDIWDNIRDDECLFQEAWTIMINAIANPEELLEFLYWIEKPEAKAILPKILESKEKPVDRLSYWKELLNKKDYLSLAIDLDLYLNTFLNIRTVHEFNYSKDMTASQLVDAMLHILNEVEKAKKLNDELAELKKLLENEKNLLATAEKVIQT